MHLKVRKRVYRYSKELVLSQFSSKFRKNINDENHWVKSVRVRKYSGPHFPAFGQNTERYGVSLHIQTKSGKM